MIRRLGLKGHETGAIPSEIQPMFYMLDKEWGRGSMQETLRINLVNNARRERAGLI